MKKLIFTIAAALFSVSQLAAQVIEQKSNQNSMKTETTSYTGESGGEPRNLASPEINTEDFSAAVDFLGLQKFVERNRIGIIGICGFGGMALLFHVINWIHFSSKT